MTGWVVGTVAYVVLVGYAAAKGLRDGWRSRRFQREWQRYLARERDVPPTRWWSYCPACYLLHDLHRTHPSLTLKQLEAIVERRVAEGRCEAHRTV